MTAFFDTNILLYSISTAPSETKKRQRALALLDAGDCVISVQVLQEFYVQATHARRTDALSHEVAAGLIGTWMRFPVEPVTPELMLRALAICARYRLSYWDSAIVAAAEKAGCDVLHSEDMKHGQKIGKLRIDNPFKGL